MADREVTQYVNDQRNLGVKDASIKKSLLDAGYTEKEAAEAMKKTVRIERLLKGKLQLTPQATLAINVMISIALVALILYFSEAQDERFDQMEQQNAQAFQALNSTINEQLDQLSRQTGARMAATESSVNSLKTSAEAEQTAIRVSLQEYRYDSLRRDSTLSASLQEVSNKSGAALSGLEKEFEELKSTTVDFSKIIPKATSAVVLIGQKNDQYGTFNTVGSGAFINSKGYIVTNEHVIDGINKITVKTSDGNEYSAAIIEEDTGLDVALIKLTMTQNSFAYLEWADSDSVYVGQPVIAIGNPVGFQSTVTQGIISNIKRHVPGSELYYFQTDVAINKGNSGGPLIDKDGKIVGIATMKFMEEGYEGLSFALRANDVKDRLMTMLYNYEMKQ